ncbi:MAG: class I adenylate-forming enzyme family protein [Phycisphaerales bacterium]
MSIHWPIIRRCLRSPFDRAVVDDRRSYRRIEILAAALTLADELARRSSSPFVGVMLPTSGAFPIAALAAWILGRTVVPLNYLLKPDELQYVIDDCRPDTIITVQPMLDFLGQSPRNVHLLKLEDVDFRAVPEPRLPARAGDSDLGVLLYTSGTSGRPKGVMLTHGNITANIRQVLSWVDFRPSEVVIGVLPQFHSFGLTVLTLLPLTLGCRVVYTARFVPHKVVRLFREHGATAFIGLPSMFNAMLHVKDATPEDFATIRFAVSGGEPLPDAVADGFKQRFNLIINEGYGLTETSPVSNWCRPQDYRPHVVGRPLPGMRQRIVDIETGQDLGPDLDGEVRMIGPNVMRGYYRLPVESAAAFDERGYFRTGDIGRFGADGQLSITGRLKEMLIVAGENVFPREIEEVLNAHPTVKDSGVIGVTDPMRGEQPVGFVELKEGQTFDERAILDWCRQRLAGYKVPRQIRSLEALPRNPTGKVLRRELRALASSMS